MRPNPWFFVPVVVSFVLGGALGWMIAGVSCGSCPVSQSITGVLMGLAVATGVGTVAVLGIRSVTEHREATEAGQPPPTPGCEVPED